MTLDLSDTQKRAIAIALMVVPALLVLWLGVELVLAHSAHHERMARLLVERADDQALLRNAPVWNLQRDALRSLSVRTPLFFGSSQPATATARMQSEVLNAISRDHVTVLRNEVELVAQNDRKRTELHMQLAFNADIAKVTSVLLHLREAHPLLFVRTLELRASPQRAAAEPLPGPTILQAELTIVGIVQVP
jgi:hypothetical protein